MQVLAPDRVEGSGRRRFEVAEERVQPAEAVEFLRVGDVADDDPAMIVAGLGQDLEAVEPVADDLSARAKLALAMRSISARV